MSKVSVGDLVVFNELEDATVFEVLSIDDSWRQTATVRQHHESVRYKPEVVDISTIYKKCPIDMLLRDIHA